MHLWLNHCDHCGAPVCGADPPGGSVVTQWMQGDGEPMIEVLPVPEPLVAAALSWTIGDLAESVLDAIAAEAAREAAIAQR